MALNELLYSWIYQVIVWPATEFDPPPITISYLFGLFWIPLSLCFALILLRINISLVRGDKWRSIPAFAMNFLLFYTIYFVSTREYDPALTATFKTLPGFLKNSSENLQFFIGSSSAMLVLIGIFQTARIQFSRVLVNSLNRNIWESALIIILGLAGLGQLYPLHDNVHLWFVTPLLLIPAAYYSKNFLISSKLHSKSLAIIMLCFLAVQGVSAHELFKVDRVRLSSYEQRGLLASRDYSNSVDKTLILLDKKIKGRDLRNNCIQGIFAVSGGKYNSIDGNFSANAYPKFAKLMLQRWNLGLFWNAI
jgi:hypothetical protein